MAEKTIRILWPLVKKIWPQTENPNSTVRQLIAKQAKKFHDDDGISYEDIKMTVDYWYNIKGNNQEPQYGIGLVPYKLKEAREYFAVKERLEEIRKENARAAKSKKKPTATTVEVDVTPITRPKGVYLFDFE